MPFQRDNHENLAGGGTKKLDYLLNSRMALMTYQYT